MNEPAKLEFSYQEGDHSLGFYVSGSLAWMKEMEAFIHYNTAFFISHNARDAEDLRQGRNELMEAFAALKELRSYQGKIVTLRVTRTEPQ